MNYENETDSSHVFYIILVILCALIILNIIERTILQDMDTNKEGFNVLYYDTVLHNIKLSKVFIQQIKKKRIQRNGRKLIGYKNPKPIPSFRPKIV